MAHHVYTTEALILESSPGREADRRYVIFTRDLGKLYASARGVRLLKSKLRYSLQDFSLTTISVVRGKESWRITNARLEHNLYQQYRGQKEVVRVFAQVFQLLKRLVPDEEKNEALFTTLTDGLDFLPTLDHGGRQSLTSFEYILVLRILEHLGYLRDVPELRQFIRGPWTKELLVEMQKRKASALAEINSSIHGTQL